MSVSTLADVAALAAVSKATASRALSRPELVASDTAARIHAAALELGFVPNRAARELASGRTGIVALVVPTLENSFFTPIIAGAQARAEAAGLQLTVAVHPLSREGELEAFARLAAQVDGFIVAAPRGDDDVVRAASAFKPTVLIDREVEGLTSVVADTATAFGSLVGRFIDDGHRDIVYIGGPDGSWQNRQRELAVVRTADGRATLTVLGPYPSTFAAGVTASADVRAARATAVVPYATAIGLGVMFALRAAPSDDPAVTVSSERMVVDALGFTDVPSLDVDGDELGRLAMQHLLARLVRNGEVPAEQVRIPVPVRWPAAPAP